MDGEIYKRKPASFRSTLAAMALATVSGWASAVADGPAQFELDMVCPFPLIGETPVKVKGAASFPSAIELNSTVTDFDVSIEAILPPLVSKSLKLLNAPATEITQSDELVTIVDQYDPSNTFEINGLEALSSNPLNRLNGTATAEAYIYQANGAVLPIALNVVLDEGIVPQDGTEVVLTGDGTVAELPAFRAVGALEMILGGINLTVSTSFEDGTPGPAPLDSFSATCEFNPVLITTSAVCHDAGSVACDLDVTHPRDANFGFVANGSTQTISLPISSASNITTASIEGYSAGDFSQSSTCNGADTCTVDVTFSPSSEGGKEALLKLNSGVWIDLKGVSVPTVEPIISLSNSTLDYDKVENGRAPVKTLTITNTGYADAASVSLQISGDTDQFRLQDTNCVDLAIGKSCDIKVEYRVLFEQGEASHSGSLVVDAGAASVSVPLSGSTGTVELPRYNTPIALEAACFLPLIEESAIEVTGSVSLPERGFIGEPLDQISLEIKVLAEENVMQGAEIVGLSYLDGAADALLEMVIPGVGIVPLVVPVDLELGVIPLDTTFSGNYTATTLYGSTTIPINLVFDNPGLVVINMKGITLRARGFQAELDLDTLLPIIDGETLNPMDPTDLDQQFHLLLDDCSSPKFVDSGVFAGRAFEFTPFTVGSIEICNPYTADFNCFVPPLPAISVSTAGLNFGDVRVNQVATQRFTISNSGDADLTVNVLTAGTGFDDDRGCPDILAPGDRCTVAVTFAPTAAGDASGRVTINSNDTDEATVIVGLVGAGVAATSPDIEVATFLDLGEARLGGFTTSELTISNLGNAGLIIADVSTSGDFSVTTNCSTVAPGANCIATVTFAPSDLGTSTGSLTINSNDADEPLVAVSLIGYTFVVVLPANIEAATDSIDFGEVAGETTAEVTFTNTGEEDFTATNISATGAFSVTNNCSFVAADASCTEVVTFSPTVEGKAETGTLTVAGAGTSATVALTGSLQEAIETFSIKVLFDGAVKFANGLKPKLHAILQAEVTEDDSLSGSLGFSTSTVKATYSGLPLVAVMKVEQAEGTEVTGSTEGTNLTVNTQVNVKFPSIYLRLLGIFKIPLGGGANCSTVTPSELTLSGTLDGEVTGTFVMSEFTGCGSFTETLTDALSGGINEVTLGSNAEILD